jgi:hypothetical protein
MANYTNNEIAAIAKADTHDLYTNFSGELRAVSKNNLVARFFVHLFHGINTDNTVLRTIKVLNDNLEGLHVNGQYATLLSRLDSLKEKVGPKQREKLVDELKIMEQKTTLIFENKLRKLQTNIKEKSAKSEDLQTELNQLKRNQNYHHEKLKTKPTSEFMNHLEQLQQMLNLKKIEELEKSMKNEKDLIIKYELSSELNKLKKQLFS